jgi:3'-phosphoadenosine 5'-phosphosulfate sulfotransferase (PAPS reductase)/FAD synthetase
VNPYLIDTPAVVSFSGGRTSGFMLRKIMDAFGGTLPDDVRVCFANTGLEHPKTYEFVEAVERNWAVPIHWLEYVGPKEFREVKPETASRRGEPFETLIMARNHLPNPVARICTVELKIRTMRRYVDSLGWTEFTNAIGLRADEQRRVAKMRGDASRETPAMPMADAGHTLTDVLGFWRQQPFDLDLPGNDNAFGNCVGCFLKGKDKLLRLMRKEPQHFDWWAKADTLLAGRTNTPNGATFRSDRPSYLGMLSIAKHQGLLFAEWDEPDTIDCACTD